jgi:hypothetical protein
MKVYVYCLTEGIEALPEKLPGMGGTEVRLFQTENFSLLVSEFSGDVVPVNRENMLVHAAVVRSVLDQTTPLPFRFGTLVTEDQLRSYLKTQREALLENLLRVRGCVEMNVKIISDRDPVEEVEEQLAEKPGTSFLLQKQREITGSEARAAEAKTVADWLEGLMGEGVRGTQIKTNITNQLLLAAAHLVERQSILEYRERLKAARAERPELKFLTSGPWPPYSFANIDLEFHTQFGVS